MAFHYLKIKHHIIPVMPEQRYGKRSRHTCHQWYRGLRDMATLVLDLGIRWGTWSHHTHLIYLQERDQVCIVEETSRAPRPV